MKFLALTALLLTGCCSVTSTTGSPSAASSPRVAPVKVTIPEPDLEIRQIVGPREQNFPEGDMEVKLELRIGNRSKVPITLRRIEIQTVNPQGGAYTLNPRAYYFKRTFQPSETGTAPFWVHAVGYGRSMRDSEPVTIRGVIDFETPGGHYNQIFVRELSQYRNDG